MGGEKKEMNNSRTKKKRRITTPTGEKEEGRRKGGRGLGRILEEKKKEDVKDELYPLLITPPDTPRERPL